MTVKQLCGEWDPTQDRIIFRLTTGDDQEFSFWLTRRAVSLMFRGIEEAKLQLLAQQHSSEVVQALRGFDNIQQEIAAQSADFSQPYLGAEQKPLGSEPQLVTGLTIVHQTDQTAMTFNLGEGKCVRIEFPAQVLMLMSALLDKLVQIAGWNNHVASAGDSTPTSLSVDSSAVPPSNRLH